MAGTSEVLEVCSGDVFKIPSENPVVVLSQLTIEVVVD